MTKRELIDYCLTYPAAFEDYPFDETAAVIKHGGNKKMFALIDTMEDKLYINLKSDPIKADFLRGIFKSVTPGWHMNKTHWNTISEIAEMALNHVIAKRNSSSLLGEVVFEEIEDGFSVQMLHTGSFDTEPMSFEMMKDFCKANTLERNDLRHREIYLSDFRKTASDKLKAVLRYFVQIKGK